MQTLAFIQNIGPLEVIIVLVVALLLFGRRLPEVGKSLGKGIVEFKKGLKGIEDEIETQSTKPAAPAYRPPLPEGGTERRVSRADAVEESASPPPGGEATR